MRTRPALHRRPLYRHGVDSRGDYWVRRLTLRQWLIRKLAGAAPVALNLTIKGELCIDRGGLICDCRIEG